MQRSETIGQLAAALAKAQAAIHGAVKDSKNPHFNSRYADLAAIAEACRKPLSDNELAVIQSPSADANLVRMTTLLLHSSGEWIESDVLQVQARDAAPQAIGSCLTYLRRYQLAAVCGVAPEDDDAEAAEGRAKSAPPPARSASAATGARPTAARVPAGGEAPVSPAAMPGEFGPVLITKIGPGSHGAIATISFADGTSILAFKAEIRAIAEKARAASHVVMGTNAKSTSGNVYLAELTDTGMTAKELAETKFSHSAPLTESDIPF